MTVFILEHLYIPESKQLLFLVRTLDAEAKVPYKLSILNRADEENKISYKGRTVDFDEIGLLSEFPNSDRKKMLQIHYDTLMNYSFVNQEDNLTYFSLHIEFLSAGNQELIDD